MSARRRDLRRKGRGRSGFTLVETVVAASVLALLLTSLAAVTASARRAAAATEVQTQRAQVRAAAQAILASEVGRAGAPPLGVGSEPVDPPYLTVTLDPARSDTIGVRYLDTSFRADPSVRSVELSAGRDRTGSPNLYLRLGAGSRQPALQGVAAIEVATLILNGRVAPPAPGAPTGVEGIVVRLSYGWGEVQDLTILFGAPLATVIR